MSQPSEFPEPTGPEALDKVRLASAGKPDEASEQPDLGDARRLALVRAAQRQWIDGLTDLGGRNTLRYYKERRAGTLDLAGADPDAVERFERTGHIKLTKLFPATPTLGSAPSAACRRFTGTRELQEERGIKAGYLATGLARWDEDDQETPWRLPRLYELASRFAELGLSPLLDEIAPFASETQADTVTTSDGATSDGATSDQAGLAACVTRPDFGLSRCLGDSTALGYLTDDRQAGEVTPDERAAADPDINRDAALLRPVDVLQVEQQRELVHDQRQADTVSERGGRVTAQFLVALDGDRADAGQHADAPHVVMQVLAADAHVLERALASPDGVRDPAHAAEGPRERQPADQR